MSSSLSRLPKGLSFKSRGQDSTSAPEESLQVIRGEKGDTGLQGAPGADSTVPGPQGDTGPAGPAGATGATGADGPTGPAGADGADGVDGVDGSTGPEGPPGPKGLPGGDSIATNKFGTRAVGIVEGSEGQWIDVVPADGKLEPWLEEALTKVVRFRSVCGNFDLVVGSPKHYNGWRLPEKTEEKQASVMKMWGHITNGTLYEQIKKEIKEEILSELRK